MPTLLSGGLRIDYADAGDGPPVLLVHSSVSGNRQWRKLIALLSAPRAGPMPGPPPAGVKELGSGPSFLGSGSLRVIAPNLRGYGGSTPWHGGRAQTLADAAQVVLELIDALQLDAPLRIVGHSFGGAVALWAAHRLGPRVSHLALYEPMLPGLLAAHGRFEAARETAALYADVKRLGAAGDWMALGARFTDYFNGDGAWQTTAPERRQLVADLLPPNPHEWDACIEPLPADTYSGVCARGLLMRGRRTRPALAEMAALLHQRFTHWRLVDVAGCGHMAPLTHADEINRWIGGFLCGDETARSAGGSEATATCA
jgi:pimeloyl-ACP methyl ester carboxylesterase